LIEGLRFIGDWRSLVFGLFIVLVMNLRPEGLLHPFSKRPVARSGKAGG